MDDSEKAEALAFLDEMEALIGTRASGDMADRMAYIIDDFSGHPTNIHEARDRARRKMERADKEPVHAE